jgi:hypothetical protein
MNPNRGQENMALESEKPLVDANSLTGISSAKGSECATAHSDRIARLSECKKRSRQMAKYIQQNYPDKKLSFQVSSCATQMVFNNYYTVDKIKLSKVLTCKKHLLCPFCARLRGAKQVQAYLEKFNQVMQEKQNLTPAFLTMTVKNGDNLEERFNHLIDSFRKYIERRRDYFKKRRGFNEFCKIDGGAFSFEFTKKNGWHPHIHAVVLLNDYIDVEKLSQEWKAITGDSFIVDIRKIKGNSQDEMAEAFVEVFKYALKFSDLALADNLHAYETLKGKRLQGSFGSFWGVKVPETLTDDLHYGLPFLELFYRYSTALASYDLTAIREGVVDHGPMVGPPRPE